MPTPAKGSPQPPPSVVGVVDALDQLERRRRTAKGKGKPAGKRGDLDLDGIR